MKKSLVESSLYNILYKLITALYPLISATYVSHIIGSEKIGTIAYAQNIVSYFVILAALGLPTYGTREIAKRANDLQQRSGLFYELAAINVISTTAALLFYGALVLGVARFHTNPVLYCIAGLQIFLNYFNVDWFYQGLEEYKYISLRNIFVKIAALVFLVSLIRTKEDYLYYALIHCLAIAGNNILNVIRIPRYLQRPRCGLRIQQHFKPILVLLIVSIAVEIYVMIDTTMLGIFCNDRIVGCYSNAMKLTRMVNTMTAAICAVMLPRLSLIYSENNLEEFNKLVNTGLKMMLLFAVPAMVGILLLSEEIIYVFFGETFSEAVPILRVLSLMIPVFVCNSLLGGQVLVTTNKEKKYAVSVTTASVINVTLNSLFIPRYGATSAAVASLISEVVVLALYVYFSRDVIQIRLPVRYIVSISIPLILFGLVSRTVLAGLQLGNLATIFVNVAACLVLYFGLGYLLGNEMMILMVEKVKTICSRKKA